MRLSDLIRTLRAIKHDRGDIGVDLCVRMPSSTEPGRVLCSHVPADGPSGGDIAVRLLIDADVAPPVPGSAKM
jgi:hypothetical protein